MQKYLGSNYEIEFWQTINVRISNMQLVFLLLKILQMKNKKGTILERFYKFN